MASKTFGTITTTRVVRETQPIQFGRDGGPSIGFLIDEHLANCAARGESIQSIELSLEPEQWEELATNVYGGYVDGESA